MFFFEIIITIIIRNNDCSFVLKKIPSFIKTLLRLNQNVLIINGLASNPMYTYNIYDKKRTEENRNGQRNKSRRYGMNK